MLMVQTGQQNDPKMILDITGSRVSHVCPIIITSEPQIILSFTLRPAILKLHVISGEVFGMTP